MNNYGIIVNCDLWLYILYTCTFSKYMFITSGVEDWALAEGKCCGFLSVRQGQRLKNPCHQCLPGMPSLNGFSLSSFSKYAFTTNPTVVLSNPNPHWANSWQDLTIAFSSASARTVGLPAPVWVILPVRWSWRVLLGMSNRLPAILRLCWPWDAAFTAASTLSSLSRFFYLPCYAGINSNLKLAFLVEILFWIRFDFSMVSIVFRALCNYQLWEDMRKIVVFVSFWL